MDIKIFQQIIDSLSLSDEHRQELKEKRGFTDAVIDAMKFRSCGPEMQWRGTGENPFFMSLPESFQKALIQKNIVIPYLDIDGAVEFIRPHKFGIEDLGIRPYIPYQYLMGKDTSTLVVAESEFKALASCLLGVPAIGIPGVGSFSKSKFPILAEVLNAFQPKRIVIVFDNEVKGDPKLPNFKPDYTKRYDTEFYAYAMAQLLKSKAHLPTEIAVLHDKWRVDGKADIDGCLARGMTEAEYRDCLSKAMTPSQYKKSWHLPAPHRSFMERKIERFFYEGPVEEEFSCYYMAGTGGRRKISNFVIELIRTIYDADLNAQRLCRFRSNYGVSKVTKILPESMVTSGAFQKFCYTLGDYEFTGTDKDLASIWRYIFMKQDGRTVIKLKSYGYDESQGVWFFGNGAYRNDVFYEMDDDGICWIEDVGFKLADEVAGMDMPTLSTKESIKITAPEILGHLSKIFDYNYARLLLGWAIGNFFMPEILANYGIYPFIFLHGKQASGKSTIANWVSSFFGFSQKGINFHNSSIAGLSRITNQMSMIPVWLEEYRNRDPDIGKKNNHLRTIYDKSTIVKGTKREDEIKTYRPRSTLIISGEEHPQDAALNSRCILFPIYRSAEDTANKSHDDYEWMQKYKSCFSIIGHQILTQKKTLWPQIQAKIEEYARSFDGNGLKISERNRDQISILAGVADIVFGHNQEFSYFVGESAQQQESKVKNDQALYIFIDDIYNMAVTGKLTQRVIERKTTEKGNEVLLWFTAAYAQWEVFYKNMRNDIPASKNALVDHMKREKYFIDMRQTRISGKSAYCMALDLDHPVFPENLKRFLESTEEQYGGNQLRAFGQN